jgi:hypothetical protein
VDEESIEVSSEVEVTEGSDAVEEDVTAWPTWSVNELLDV